MLRGAYDYIIVGGGSAGSVLASRLSENRATSVLLLEAGGSDRKGFSRLFLQMPTALAMPMHYKKYNWAFETEKEPTLNNRSVSCPRGRGLGGSSSINGLVWVRGNKMDFDNWEKCGAKGWSYKDVLPFFRKAENWQGGENAYRGGNGPLHTKFGDNAAKLPLFDAIINAGREAGYKTPEDYNGEDQEGFSKMQMSVFHQGPNKGKRSSASQAYIHSLQNRDNLTVKTNSSVSRILFDEKDPKKVIGVELTNSEIIRCNKETIVSCGAIQSPQLLQVSGVGDSDHLTKIGVKTVHHLPGVGKNLQDHLELYFQVESPSAGSLTPWVTNPLRKLMIGIQWLLFRNGLGASNHFESCAFVKSSPTEEYPNIQFHFLPVAISYDGKSVAKTTSGHSFQLHIGSMRSKSRGSVLAKAADVTVPPTIKFNYMSHEDDWKEMRESIKIARKVVAQPSMSKYAGREILPGKNIQTDEQLNGYIKEHVESAYHPCGTCKMGDPSDKMAVVDHHGKVFGVSGLRVVDASIFPIITCGNLNSPTIMIAEKMADHIINQ